MRDLRQEFVFRLVRRLGQVHCRIRAKNVKHLATIEPGCVFSAFCSSMDRWLWRPDYARLAVGATRSQVVSLRMLAEGSVR
jgi:hypothetical protein